MANNELQSEIQKRRTFAIISHPDAGKTTLTEKFLLLGGAIRLAGSVKARKNKKFATSDWMDLEKQRGISVSSSVMNFNFEGTICNLLDTPGHQDFSEDTYRTLAAADAAIMLIDAAKGIEPQTIKLFEVCRLRNIPICTFVNKLDRDSKDPLDLMDEIEKTFNIKTYPMTWPIGSGDRFAGVVDRTKQVFHAFQGARTTSTEAEAEVIPMDNKAELEKICDAEALEESLESLEMVEIAGEDFSAEEYNTGKMTPVFFGSAMTSFGVRTFLEKFIELSPAPYGKRSSAGMIEPENESFSGFVFKIQANMDPKHRDRVAFLRVVSGVYEVGKSVYNSRLKREIKLTTPQQFFAQERTTAQKVYPGDIVGMYDPGVYAIGDTLCEGNKFEFEGIPSFAPENFSILRTKSALKRKQLMKGLTQLCQEGTVQMFIDENRAASDPIVAAVGVLQFDVLLFRLNNEYNIDCELQPLPYQFARWTDATPEQKEEVRMKTDSTLVTDIFGNDIYLFSSEFQLSYFEQNCPEVNLYKSNSALHKNMMDAEL